MDHWRAFFGDSDKDIWTIIEQAIILAATDYPKEFKIKRSDIAETLFARRLLELNSGDIDATRLSGSVVTNTTNLEENEVRDDGDETVHTRREFGAEADRHLRIYDDAEALNEAMEEETLVIKELYRIKETLMGTDHSEKSLLDLLHRLEYLQVTVEALKATEIGRQVNNLRKHHSKRVRSSVKRLVSGWKDLVDEWVKTAGDVAAAAIAGDCDTAPMGNEEQGLPSPPLEEGDLLAASTTSLEMSQFLSFMDEEIPTGNGEANHKEDYCVYPLEPGIKDQLHISAKSQSRSMQTDFNKNGVKANIQFHSRGISLPEERGSSNRVDSDGSDRIERRPESDSRNSTSQNGVNSKKLEFNGSFSTNDFCSHVPGRPANEVSKIRISGKTGSSGSGSNCDKNWKPFSVNKFTYTEDVQTAQKLELCKKKLHEGYQQAENAKKQRTVQLVDLPDLPKEGINRGKVNSTGQNRPFSQNWHWNQNRR